MRADVRTNFAIVHIALQSSTSHSTGIAWLTLSAPSLYNFHSGVAKQGFSSQVPEPVQMPRISNTTFLIHDWSPQLGPHPMQDSFLLHLGNTTTSTNSVPIRMHLICRIKTLRA